MCKRKVKVPHPITGEPFEVELETITLSYPLALWLGLGIAGHEAETVTVTGYRYSGAVVEYKEPRKHSAYFESAEQEERLRAELVALWGTFAKAFLTKLGPTPPEDHPVLMSRMQWLEMQCDYLLERHLEALPVISRLRDALDAARAGGKRGGRPSIKPPGTDDLIRDMVTKNNKWRGTRRAGRRASAARPVATVDGRAFSAAGRSTTSAVRVVIKRPC